MLGKKRLCGMILCGLLLAGCAKNKQAYVFEMPEKSETSYEIAEVTQGTFTMFQATSGTEAYWKKESVICEYEGAILKQKIQLKRGDKVKAGDVIATVFFETDDVELARLELAYERAVYSMNSGISSYYQSIASVQGDDRISYLQALQMEYQLGAYKLSANRQCEQALERLEEYKSRYEEVQIVAPCDGIVTYVGTLQAGSEIPMGTELITLADADSKYLEIELDIDFSKTYPAIAFGNGVTITSGDSCEGEVVSAPVLGAGYNPEENNQTICVNSDGLSGLTSSGTYSVRYTLLEVENMIMVPRKAVYDYNTPDKEPYVKILQDDTLLIRYVICGPANGSEICILDGLTPGQLVVLE